MRLVAQYLLILAAVAKVTLTFGLPVAALVSFTYYNKRGWKN